MVLGVIGAGNMAQALISGIIKSKVLESNSIIVSNYNSKKAEDLVKKYNVLVEDNINVIRKSNVILLAVKPYAVIDTLNQYIEDLKDKIVISVAAGISISDMEQVSSTLKIIRTMPNTPVEVCEGVIAYSKGKNISNDDIHYESLVLSHGVVQLLSRVCCISYHRRIHLIYTKQDCSAI